MSEDPITVLERELLEAARRRAAEQQYKGRRMTAGRLVRGFGPAIAVAITLAIGAGALLLLGGHKQSTARNPSVPSAASAVPGRRQLLEIISVLRRPQTKADLNLNVLPRLSRGLIAAGTPDLSLVRFATRTPWGERLYFVPMKPPTPKALATLERQRPQLPQSAIRRISRRGETLGVFSSEGGGGAGTAAEIAAGQGVETEGAGHSFAGGSTETRLILVVPDGVAKVQFVLPRQPQPGLPGAPTYEHSATVAASVHDNVAAVQVDREFDGATSPMIWYSADGQVIKRIGNFASVSRVVAPPQAGPETPLSRAAERDPSTPNPVWVTPSIGGPHTNFMLHFRVLLNDADYSYRLTGTRCPAITVNGGDGGGGALGLRGRIWSDVVDAVSGQTWCPGTYHLSATVMDRGRYGMLQHPAAPFGTATFTVHR